MAQPVVDRAYTNLLIYLQRPSLRQPLQTVLSAIPHYLSDLPLPHPTQLTAFIIASSLWRRLSVEDLWSLATSFRSAVHLKYVNVQKESESTWFSRSPPSLLGDWLRGVMNGAGRGGAHLRITTLGGLLLGLEDIGPEGVQSGVRERVETQAVIAFAEVLETFSPNHDEWKTEFATRRSSRPEDMNGTMFLYMASQILPVVSPSKFRALDLTTLIYLSLDAIKSTYSGGDFILYLSQCTSSEPGGRISISPSPSLSKSLQVINQDVLYQSAGPLAKLLARGLSQLAEVTPMDAWQAFYHVSQEMESMVYNVERDWQASQLAAITSEQDIELHSRETSTTIWSILKTLLFSHILVSQSMLSSILFMRPQLDVPSNHGPSAVARIILRSLHHLAFVLSRFGGVTSAEGFKELKRVFFMAIDIITSDQDPTNINSLVEELLSTIGPELDINHPFRQAKVVYALAIVEQLVPMLSGSVLENQVLPFCSPYLGHPQSRDTYESAHSVILSIFAAHAREMEEELESERSTFTEKLVPFYLNSLMETSNKGRLSRAQLKLAYSSVVRSTAASCADDSLTWLCVETLLSRMDASAFDSSQRMDLCVTLVSLISCVPFSLLERQLKEVDKILDTAGSEDRKVLAEAVLEEITNRVGHHGREIALCWWCMVTSRLSAQDETAS